MTPEAFAMLIAVCAQRQVEFPEPDFYRPVPALVECAREIAASYPEFAEPSCPDPQPVPQCACDTNADGFCGGADWTAFNIAWREAEQNGSQCPSGE
jgi:hypothetical protein